MTDLAPLNPFAVPAGWVFDVGVWPRRGEVRRLNLPRLDVSWPGLPSLSLPGPGLAGFGLAWFGLPRPDLSWLSLPRPDVAVSRV